jgi:rSAM/selenodomain-associated transferase 1
VKTRLCPPLTSEAAAELQRACLGDLWARLGCLTGVHRVLCHHPPGSAERFCEILGRDTDLMAQPEGELGQRLIAGFDQLFAHGLGPIVAVGADSPDLPLEILSHALNSLQDGQCEVALGPAADGGYTLIGLSQPHPGIFHAIPWSTSEVFSSTLERCRQAKMSVLTLPVWYDVDDAPSLARLRESALAAPADLPRLYQWFHSDEG